MMIHSIGQNGSERSQVDVSQMNDAESKGIQNQITVAQQQLQRLASNQELTMEEKKQKRQEVQKQITDLNRELKQHQAELRREQFEEKNSEEVRKQDAQKDSEPEETADKKAENEKRTEELREKEQGAFRQNEMAEMMSAQGAGTQAEKQKKVVMDLEGTAQIMRGEIRLDTGRGRRTEHKKAALADVEQRAFHATNAQMAWISNAVEGIHKMHMPDGNKAGRKGAGDDSKLADVIGRPQKNQSQNAMRSYQAGKKYHSVTFHV